MLTSLYVLIYEGFELLDMAGPVSVFSTANRLSSRPLYDIKIISANGGLVTSSCGLQTQSTTAKNCTFKNSDTFLVSGASASPLGVAINDPQIIEIISKANKSINRLGSVCSGSFLLAEAGLLKNRQCTTHWIASDALQKIAPTSQVNSDALYIEDGNIWTSAGVTTGIDMSLAILAQDHGKKLMGEVARHLVVYSHRPGNQSQFSQYLEQQLKVTPPLAESLYWINENLHLPIRIANLAEVANMSERSFYRRFCAEVGETPAKYIEQQKMKRAQVLLVEGAKVKAAQLALGYRSESAFRAVFERFFGVTPQTFKNLHC